MREIRLWTAPLEGHAAGQTLDLNEAESHHFGTVLRGREGDEVILMDGLGFEAEAQCVVKEKRRISFFLQSLQKTPAGPTLRLLGPIPKSKRFPTMLEKLQELGLTSYAPLATEHSVREDYSDSVREKSVERLQEACKQSRSPWMMSLLSAQSLDEMLTNQASQSFETSKAAPLGLVQNTIVLDVGGSSIWDFPVYGGGPIQLMFGPEAGWSEAERGHFRHLGLRTLGLSANHLRMETAAILGAGFVLEWMNRKN